MGTDDAGRAGIVNSARIVPGHAVPRARIILCLGGVMPGDRNAVSSHSFYLSMTTPETCPGNIQS